MGARSPSQGQKARPRRPSPPPKGEQRATKQGKEARRQKPSPPPVPGGGRNEIAHLLESATQEGGRYYTNPTYQLEQEPQRCESCLLPGGAGPLTLAPEEEATA